jgi:preprotein translocase subunit SecE
LRSCSEDKLSRKHRSWIPQIDSDLRDVRWPIDKEAEVL